MMASASAATMPTVDPAQVPNHSLCVASVTVASIVLSPSSASRNATVTAITAERWRPARLRPLVVGEGVASERPAREAEERQTSGEGDPHSRERGAQPVADRDRHGMDRRGCDRDADQDRKDAVARREGHRHQLGLVPEFGDEDDPETHEEARYERVHRRDPLSIETAEAGLRGSEGMRRPRPGQPPRVEGLAHLTRSRPPGREPQVGRQHVDRGVSGYSPSRRPACLARPPESNLVSRGRRRRKLTSR